MSRTKENYRRCHVCEATSESFGEEKILKCKGCGRAFAPFYYFKVSDIKGYAVDNKPAGPFVQKRRFFVFAKQDPSARVFGEHLCEDDLVTNYQPLRGLAVIW